MYLFVFIFVILSVMGLYTELFSLQMANLVSKQKIAAETMMFWHGAVSSFALDKRASITLPLPATGCAIAIGASVCGLPTFNRGPIAGKIYLPADYNISNDAELRFTTRLYRAANGDFLVLTFVNPSILNPPIAKMGYTVEQIKKQMANAQFPPIIYGTVKTGTCLGGSAGRWLMTEEYVNGAQVCYEVPPSLTAVTDGAVGIIRNLGS